ncbi:MAG: hypothetical protein Ct9H300mP13_2900 [Gammaproteobacteria bacterium]|nr:MAG: hypothetical protein Ct9H300mP13_2900 [Gammaproteobacteria bacterium]
MPRSVKKGPFVDSHFGRKRWQLAVQGRDAQFAPGRAVQCDARICRSYNCGSQWSSAHSGPITENMVGQSWVSLQPLVHLGAMRQTARPSNGTR